MDKQIMELLNHFLDIKKEVQSMEVKHIKEISDLKNQVTENKVNIKNINENIIDVKDIVNNLNHTLDNFSNSLNDRFDRMEDKIDRNKDKFDSINDELLVRRLIVKIINNNPNFMKIILTLIISSLVTALLYLFALFIQ